MQQIDLDNLTDEQKVIIFRLGLMKIIESVYEGVIPIDKFQKNINSIRQKIGLEEEQIWECYKFWCEAMISIGKPKVHEKIGFIKE